MKKIFIVHAWPEDADKSSKQRTFIRKLKYELEQKNFKLFVILSITIKYLSRDLWEKIYLIQM